MAEFLTAKRALHPILVLALGLAGCADRDHYIRNAPSPHEVSTLIPEGRVFPPGVLITLSGGSAEFKAPLGGDAAAPGVLAVQAFCGNPIDKRDPDNLYAVIGLREENGTTRSVTAGIPNAAVCADGVLNRADQAQL